MPIDWNDNIVLAELADEPELAEELSAIFARLTDKPAVGGDSTRLPSVVLNFASVSYLNSSHIAALLRLRKRLLESGSGMVLCSLNDEIMSMIGLTGLEKVFQFAPDTMTALARVQIDAELRGHD